MRFGRAIAFAALALAAAGCEKKQEPAAAGQQQAAAPAASDTILIGHVASLTGAQATFGESTDNGIKLAIDEANASRRREGQEARRQTYDDQGKPEEAADAATRLITQDKVAVLLGEVASSRSLAMAPIADASKVPMITPSSTNPRSRRTATRPGVHLPRLLHRPVPGLRDGEVRAART